MQHSQTLQLPIATTSHIGTGLTPAHRHKQKNQTRGTPPTTKLVEAGLAPACINNTGPVQ